MEIDIERKISRAVRSSTLRSQPVSEDHKAVAREALYFTIFPLYEDVCMFFIAKAPT